MQPTLNSLTSENVKVELKDVDTRSHLLCAAKVIANHDNQLHFNDTAEEYMSKQTRFQFNKFFSGVKTGDWVTFTPAHVLGLQQQADKISEVRSNTNGMDSGSFKPLSV